MSLRRLAMRVHLVWESILLKILIYLQSKWRPGAFCTVYTMISHSSVADWGGGIIIRNRDWQLNSWSILHKIWAEGGAGGQFSIYRAKNKKCRTRPPTTYANTRLVDDRWCSLPAACKTKLNPIASLQPHCAVHMQKAISLHFSRVNLNGCRDLGWPYRASVFGTLYRLQASNKNFVVCHLWHPNISVRGDMRFQKLWVIWLNIAFIHKSDPRFARNWESNSLAQHRPNNVLCQHLAFFLAGRNIKTHSHLFARYGKKLSQEPSDYDDFWFAFCDHAVL